MLSGEGSGLTAEEAAFLERSRTFGFVAGACEFLIAPGFSERVAASASDETDPLRVRAYREGLEAFAHGQEAAIAMPLSRPDCEHRLGNAIAELALANAALAAAETQNGAVTPDPPPAHD